MKPLKHIATLLIIVVALFFTACTDKEIESKTPLDVRYTPQHQETVTDYEYKFNVWQGDFVLVPNIHTETIPDKYEVQYIVMYTNGDTVTRWEEVDKTEYDAAAAMLAGGGGGIK